MKCINEEGQKEGGKEGGLAGQVKENNFRFVHTKLVAEM